MSFAFAQNDLLQAGPMVGFSTMREVMIWVQTTEAARVQVLYVDQAQEEEELRTAEVQTRAADSYVAKLIAATEPGKTYSYQVYINGRKLDLPYKQEFQSQTLWQWRTDPPAFSFVIGSCNYVNEEAYDRPGNPYGGGYEIFQSILEQDPDFMLWTGDNTYLREADWNSWGGIRQRYTHTRSLPEMQPLLGSVHQYAIWDDHDYGPNNADRSYWLKDYSLETFKLFWANPNYGPGGGISGTFFWQDAQFFLLDNRYFRTSDEEEDPAKQAMFGEQQLEWLLDALRFSRAPFKFVVMGNQALNNYGDPSYIEAWSEFPRERKAFMDAILVERIPGVIFLSGDRHQSELSKLDRPGTYPLYDLTVSPLTAGANGDRGQDDPNTLRVNGTYFGGRNFAKLTIYGLRRERVLKIELFDNTGKVVWTREIKEPELR